MRASDAEREVDEEDPVPAGVGGDEAAERRAEDEGGEAGPGDVGDGLGELVLGRVAQDDEAADGDHHGAAEALEDAHQGELGEGVGDAAEQGGEGEDGDGGGEDGAGAEAVGDPAADGDEDGEGEQVGRHADVEADGADVEAARHLRQRGGDDGAVEVFHEEGARDEGGDVERGAALHHGSILQSGLQATGAGASSILRISCAGIQRDLADKRGNGGDFNTGSCKYILNPPRQSLSAAPHPSVQIPPGANWIEQEDDKSHFNSGPL